MDLTARNTSLDALATLLRTQEAHKLDVVAPATALSASGGRLVLSGVEPIKISDERIDENGVTPAEYFNPNGAYDPTDIAVGHLAEKLGIDTRYLRKLAANRPDIFDANVNGWLHGLDDASWSEEKIHPADSRSFLLRAFRPVDGGQGVMRGLMSDRYAVIDHLDVLTAALKGIRKAGLNAQIVGCDLTERRMRVRVVIPEATVWAAGLFENYRTPFRDGGPVVRVGGPDGGDSGWTVESARRAAQAEGSGYAPGTEPIVFAGFEIGNDELGGGAAAITPLAIANICGNGLRISAEAERKTHVGGRLEEGVIQWSRETREAELATMVSKVADAAVAFGSASYWQAKVDELSARAGKPVDRPAEAVKVLGKKLGWAESETDDILSHFTLGGQLSAGGVMNAVTSFAQTVSDPDRAADLEASAVKVLDLV